MRSLLLVSPTDPTAVGAAFAAVPDALVLDLASGERDPSTRMRARGVARDILRAAQSDDHRPHLYVRIEDLEDPEVDRDLKAVMSGEPDGVLLAACRSGADVQHLGAKLAVHEAEYGLVDGGTMIIAEAVGRAGGVFGLGSYGEVGSRLIGLCWDAGSLARDLGISGAWNNGSSLSPLETARHLTLFAARAADVAAIDAASLSRDLADLEAECRATRRIGFNGKLVSRPSDVALVHAIYDKGVQDEDVP